MSPPKTSENIDPPGLELGEDPTAGAVPGPIDARRQAERARALQRRAVAFLRGRNGRIATLIVLDVGFALVMGAASSNFLTFSNFKQLFIENSMEIALTGFMALLLIGGVFDLSVDGVINMCGVIAGLLLVRHVPVAVAVVAALAAGALVGAVNGVAVTWWRMNPLMTTLGTWWATQGIAYGLTTGTEPTGFSSGFDNIGSGSIAGLSNPVVYLIVLALVLGWLLHRSRFGYHVYATGGNREGARLRGVRVNRVLVTTFILMGLASAFMGIVVAGQVDASSPFAVNGENLRVIAGAVIGGCSLTGGRGSVAGALLGALFMVMLNNAVIVLGINPYWEYTALGVVVFAAVAIDAAAARNQPA